MSKLKNCILGLAIITMLVATSVNGNLMSVSPTEWSSNIKINTNYYYIAQKSELRDLKTEEKYHNDLIGGHNIPGGDTRIMITNNLSSDFNLFEGDRLQLTGAIEGDIGLESPGHDYDLIFLPIVVNGDSFFQLLFDNETVLEQMTEADFVTGKMTEHMAIATLKINDFLNTTYTWDLNTGILLEKQVQAKSGKMLLIVMKGDYISGYDLAEVLGGFLLLEIVIIRKRMISR